MNSCPNCQHTGLQSFRGERFNTHSLSHEGMWKCETCLCEYTQKDSGRIVVTKPGMTSREIRDERHKLAIETIVVSGIKQFENRATR